MYNLIEFVKRSLRSLISIAESVELLRTETIDNPWQHTFGQEAKGNVEFNVWVINAKSCDLFQAKLEVC